VPLGLRVTPKLKLELELAAILNGRSISQEAELRLEQSLDIARRLVIARGPLWSPILIHKGELLVGLGDDPRDYSAGQIPPHQEHIVTLKISADDLKRLRNYFDGAPWPYTYSKEEIREAGERHRSLENEIKRGK
jgi:hypothetical protein